MCCILRAPFASMQLPCASRLCRHLDASLLQELFGDKGELLSVKMRYDHRCVPLPCLLPMIRRCCIIPSRPARMLTLTA